MELLNPDELLKEEMQGIQDRNIKVISRESALIMANKLLKDAEEERLEKTNEKYKVLTAENFRRVEELINITFPKMTDDERELRRIRLIDILAVDFFRKNIDSDDADLIRAVINYIYSGGNWINA